LREASKLRDLGQSQQGAGGENDQKGLMTPAGQALIDLANKTGTWEALVDG
jgi:hypothetical protein